MAKPSAEPPSSVYRDCQCGTRDLNIIRGRWPRHNQPNGQRCRQSGWPLSAS